MTVRSKGCLPVGRVGGGVQMQSASDENKPFLVEPIHAVVTTVEIRRRHPIPRFTVTQSAIYIFLVVVVVFFFIFQD